MHKGEPTTKIGPEEFVISRGEVLKARQGKLVTSADLHIELVPLGAHPGRKNCFCGYVQKLMNIVRHEFD